ncbi:restriction endonuclease subunit S [Bifidobacterium catenulatum]|uniref:restriction endonuclease subunit S n=1 Tax=Bifidobacterium catenulatum TaxID=1686 RepID=UPI003D34C921
MAEQHGKALVPQIRFAGFTDPWEQRKLGEVANVCSGRDYKHLAEGPIPVYGTGGYMTSVSKALSYDEDAIGIGRKGTIDKPYRLQAPFWTVDTLFYAIPEASSDINFLLCSFLNVDWKSKDESTGLPSLSKRAINETEVLVPDNGEQRRIGAFFDRLDSLITLHQRKYDKLCVLKKSMLDKMFPKGGSLYPEIRFAGFTDPWEQRKLGELTESYSGGTPAAGESEFYGGSIPFIRSAEIASESTELFLTGKGYESSSARMVKPGDVLYALYGATSGEVAVSKQKGAINQAILAILPHDDCDAKYLAAWLRRQKDYIVTTFLQGGQGNLSGVIVKNLEVAIPSLPEQQRIGSCLSLLDSLITLHQRKLELLRNIKKSMLDKMFV